MNWRVISLEEHDAALNMAIDEAILEGVAAGTSPPTLRFYRWRPSAVSIGYFQSLALEVDSKACMDARVDVVRRKTGGGAVYHDDELTYSVIAKESLFPKGITESYREICGWIMQSLVSLGMQPLYHPINDILVGNKKISGNAQTRRNGVLLQHGTILYTVDVAKMFSLLKVDDIKIKDKLISDVRERVTSVVQQNPAITKQQLYDALVQGFTRGKQWAFGYLTAAERARAEVLRRERYQDLKWTGMR